MVDGDMKARESVADEYRLSPLVATEDPRVTFIGPRPGGWETATADGIPTSLRAAIRECAAGRQRWPLYVHGPPGTRKSWTALIAVQWFGGTYTTAAAMANELIEVKFGRVLHPGSGGLKKTLRDFWGQLSATNLLALDELGIRNQPTDNEFEAVHGALEARTGRPLILIANAPPEQLGQVYDERIVSRCRAGTIIEVAGEDSRTAHHHAPPVSPAPKLRGDWSTTRCPTCGTFSVKRLRTKGDEATFVCMACPPDDGGQPRRFIARRHLTPEGRGAECDR